MAEQVPLPSHCITYRLSSTCDTPISSLPHSPSTPQGHTYLRTNDSLVNASEQGKVGSYQLIHVAIRTWQSEGWILDSLREYRNSQQRLAILERLLGKALLKGKNTKKNELPAYLN